MKQIILNITKDKNNNQTIIVNATYPDDSKIVKVIPPSQITQKDNKFLSDLEALIVQNYGG